MKYNIENITEENVNNAIDEYGSTALILSIRHDDIESVNTLIKMGADVNLDLGNGTSLEWALEKAQFNIMIYLVMNGAKISTPFLESYKFGQPTFMVNFARICKNGFGNKTRKDLEIYFKDYNLYKYLHEKHVSQYDPDFTKFLINVPNMILE